LARPICRTKARNCKKKVKKKKLLLKYELQKLAITRLSGWGKEGQGQKKSESDVQPSTMGGKRGTKKTTLPKSGEKGGSRSKS